MSDKYNGPPPSYPPSYPPPIHQDAGPYPGPSPHPTPSPAPYGHTPPPGGQVVEYYNQQPYGQYQAGYGPQQGYPPQGHGMYYGPPQGSMPPQGYYADGRGGRGGATEGLLAGLLAALACCCCLDFVF